MAEQGCPHEGADHRRLGRLICWLQQKLSFASNVEPATLILGFPFYVAINLPLFWRQPKAGPPRAGKPTQWGVVPVLHFGAGIRYDFNARFYLVPRLALKLLDRALLY